MNIGLDKIRIDCGTQARASIDQAVVANYAEEMLMGAVFPPVTVFHDGVDNYLADGYHRYFAAKMAGSPGIDVTVINGTLRDAVMFSLSANHDHGLHRSNADKRKAVVTMIDDFEWTDWSDREIAKACKVGHSLVSIVRNEMGKNKEEVKYERNGKVETQKVGNKRGSKKDKPHVDEKTDEEKEQLFEAVDVLTAENQVLTDKLAVLSISPEAAEREMAESLIAELRNHIKLLEIELKAVKQSRDTYQSEKAQLMKQNAMLQKKLKKYESGE